MTAPSRLRPAPVGAGAVLLVLSACMGGESPPDSGERGAGPPAFEAHQPDLFAAPGAQPVAWADYDGDSDLDLFVGFRRGPNRLYRNDARTFTDVAAAVGIADTTDTRAAAWGDFDGDGDLDLYVGFGAGAGTPNRLYRNEGGGRAFTDVAAEAGVAETGTTRQPAFVDFDGDGDMDLFVAFRDKPNRLYRNDGGAFTDVAPDAGVADPRRTVGAVWFDMDEDGDLDLFVANQEGDEDGVYLNRGDGTFSDEAARLGMNRPGRAPEQGSVGVAVGDPDGDGDLDLFVAGYGPDLLWENQGDGTFRAVGEGSPLAEDRHSVAAAWGDVDHDGRPDLYVGRFLAADPQAPDALLLNTAAGFVDATPAVARERGASHGVAWADFDMDGDLDLALANNDTLQGGHPLYTNGLPDADAARSLQVVVLDGAGRWNRVGARVTAVAEGTDPAHPDGFRVAGLVDAGGGYAAQGAAPVHFGFPSWVTRVSVAVEWFEKGERRTATVSGVEPARFRGQWLVLKLEVR